MSKPETEKLKSEFYEFCDNSEDGLYTLSRKGTDKIADFWLKKIAEREAESREKMIEAISEDITNYDEVYISEDVRKAINRMKFNLKSIIKNKE